MGKDLTSPAVSLYLARSLLPPHPSSSPILSLSPTSTHFILTHSSLLAFPSHSLLPPHPSLSLSPSSSNPLTPSSLLTLHSPPSSPFTLTPFTLPSSPTLSLPPFPSLATPFFFCTREKQPWLELAESPESGPSVQLCKEVRGMSCLGGSSLGGELPLGGSCLLGGAASWGELPLPLRNFLDRQ